jgi:hypothetical protein
MGKRPKDRALDIRLFGKKGVELAMPENDQATRGLANGSRRARSFIQQCDLPDVLSRPARDHCRASPFDSHLALHDHKELVAPLALSRQDLPGRDVDILGQLAESLHIATTEIREQWYTGEQLELFVTLTQARASVLWPPSGRP